MDFIEGLPTSSMFNCIMVIVDKFSKYSHFLALKHPLVVLINRTKMSIHRIYKLHGLPTIIVSDRDRVFTGSLWQNLFKLAGTDLLMSTAQPTTLKRMTKANVLISVLRLTCVALYMPILPNGESGSPWQNTGTIPATI